MESISRISSMLETARDLTLEAARDASAAKRTSMRTLPSAQLKKLLDSRHEREVLEGLRKVIAMSYRPANTQPTLPYFSHVIKNIASSNLEIKKLVYIYLLTHAEADPDTALLSINSIQKSLSDSNPQVRALALRVMSGIRVPVISQIVSLGIKKGCGDMSPYVRKAAALAIPKCYRLDPSTEPQLIEYIRTLLMDKQYYVAGAAVAAFLEVCPERIDLVHPVYKGLVRKLVDMDEWGQLATLRLMTRYARMCFPRRTRRVKKVVAKTKGFYDDDGTDEDEDTGEVETILDLDLELLLKATKPLLQSRNSAVVVAVARCYIYLGTQEYIDQAVGPLISLLRGPQDIQSIALYDIVQVCLSRPQSFIKYSSHFLIRTTDSPQIWRLKLEVLTLIFPYADARTKALILSELEHFSRGHDTALVRESVRAIGRCSQSDSSTSARCMSLLLSQIGSPDGNLVAESLEVIRHLIQRDPEAHTKTVIRLAKHLDTATNPQARASIIWLVGEFSGIQPDNNIAADVLRILAKGFADEAEPAKLQTVLLAAKVYLQHLNLNREEQQKPATQATQSTVLSPEQEEGGFQDVTPDRNQHSAETDDSKHVIAKLWHYILLLARYDTSYDLRDRARAYKALLSVPSSTELASLVLLAPKPVPQIPSPSETRKGFTLGSATLVVGEESGVGGLPGYETLPEWVKEGHEPDPALRNDSYDKPAYGEPRSVTASEKLDEALHADQGNFGRTNGTSAKEKTLDDWLAEDDNVAGSDEEEEEEEDSEEEESTEAETEEESTEEESDEDEEHDRLVKGS